RDPAAVGQVPPGIDAVGFAPAVRGSRVDRVRLRDPIQRIVGVGRAASQVDVVENLKDVAIVAGAICVETARGAVDRSAEMEVVAKAEYRVLPSPSHCRREQNWLQTVVVYVGSNNSRPVGHALKSALRGIRGGGNEVVAGV